MSDPADYLPVVQAALDAATPRAVADLRAFLACHAATPDLLFELAWNTDHALHGAGQDAMANTFEPFVTLGGLQEVLEPLDPEDWMDTFESDEDIDEAVRAWFLRCWTAAGGDAFAGEVVLEDGEEELFDVKRRLRSDEPGAFGDPVEEDEDADDDETDEGDGA